VRDLSLGHVLLKAQAQDQLLAVGESCEQPVEVGGVFGALVAVLVAGECLDEVEVAVVRDRDVE
jgi:hypothetical protein